MSISRKEQRTIALRDTDLEVPVESRKTNGLRTLGYRLAMADMLRNREDSVGRAVEQPS